MRRSLQTTCAIGASFVLLIATVGCGDSDKLDVFPTQGLVLLDDEPFGPTRIQLVPADANGRTTTGEVDDQGKVTFTSYQVGDGAPAGQYKVVIGTVMAPPPKPFPGIYRNSDSTPLKVTVEPNDKNELVIAMDSKAGRPASDKGADMMSRAKMSPEFRAGAAPPAGQ